MGVFEGCFRKIGVQGVVFAGEFVVVCVVNAVSWWSLI
jgi:hypothetical protein